MSIWTDDKGRRHVGIMVEGRRVHRKLPEGATARDAKLVEADLRAALSRQKQPRIPSDPPLAEVMAAYIEHADTLRSPDTAKHHAHRIGRWCLLYRASQARECAAHIVRDMSAIVDRPDGTRGPAYQPATVNRSLGTLKMALRQAWERGDTLENYGLRVKRLPEKNAREVFLTVEQVAKLASHCQPAAAAAIWAALLTGARRGELHQIRREHIGADAIEIPASHTKTLRSRVVPIVPALRPWLEHFPLQISADGIKSAFRRARVRAGMAHVHFHDLRHSCASILIGLGVDLYTVSKILGHTNVATTQRYAHLLVEHQRTALDKLSGLVLQRGKRAA